MKHRSRLMITAVCLTVFFTAAQPARPLAASAPTAETLQAGQETGEQETVTEETPATEEEGTLEAQEEWPGEPSIEAPSGVLMEASTGTVVYEKNADVTCSPASITKIMTLLLIFEALEKGDIRLEDEVMTSAHAQSMGGSQVFLEEGEMQTVDTLIKCIAVASGNDAAVAMAEFIAGSEEEFVSRMNEKAQELGMKNTHFENSTGLHDENHYSTVGDLALLLQYAVKNETFEEIFCSRDHFVEPTDGHPEGLMMRNSMFKLRDDWIVENGEIRGGKTGFTDEAGLCLASEAMIGNEKYIAVTAGAEGNHGTEPYHVLDAFYLYGQLDNRWKVRTDE